MGNSHSDCSTDPRSPVRATSAHTATPPPEFNVANALVDLPPNVYVNRVDPGPPSCCLTGEQFLALQPILPLHITYRKWQLVYGSEEHGFSLGTLRSQLERNTKNRSRKKTPALLIVQAGGQTMGAYLSRLPALEDKMHVGTSETFVFAFDGDYETGIRKYSSVAESTTGALPTNDYFVRCTPDILAVGGGGKGPALSVTDDMYVSSSTHCPTFETDYEALLRALPGSSVELEGNEPRAPIERIELWLISEQYFGVY